MFWIYWVKWNIILQFLIYIFLLVKTLTTRKFKITYMTSTIVLLSSTVVENTSHFSGEESWLVSVSNRS